MTNLAAEARAKAQAKYPGATVHGRGRNWIRHQHPTNPDRFIFDTHLGPIHYGAGEDQEIDTAWQTSSGNWDYEVIANNFHCFVRDSVPVSYRYYDVATGHYVELTWSAVQWVNDGGDSENVTQFQQVTPTIDDDLITWPNIAAGWHVAVNAQTARLQKRVTIDSLSDLGAPTIGGTNIRLRFSLTFQKSSGLEVWSGGEKWGEKNNTWLETVDNLEFRDTASQNAIFWFKKPWAKDNGENDEGPIVTQRVRRTGVNYYAEIDVPWTWLQAATYPITIDPTIDDQVGASADDVYRYSSTGFDASATAARIGYDRNCAARFTNISGLSGATITTSYISYYVNGGAAEAGVLSKIWAEDATAPTQITSYTDYNGRTLTTAGVDWDGEFGSDSTWADSPSINTVIQELADSYDPSVIQIIHNDDATAPGTRYIGIAHYDNSSSTAPKLHIEYTGGGAGDLSISAATDTAAIGESVILDGIPNPNVSESTVTLGESVTAKVSDPAVSVSDDLTVGESVTVELGALSIGVSESTVTLGESVAARLDILVNESETSITIGESITVDLRAAWYNPDSITVNTGSVVSGTIEDTWSDNGTKLQLAETTGTPGFDYDFYFYDVPAEAYSIAINGYYDGNPGHNVKIQQYNFTTTSWTDLTPDGDDFPSTGSDQTYTFPLFGGVNYNSSGEVRIKLVHTTAGSNLHNFYIDHMVMSSQVLAVHVTDDDVTTGESVSVALDDLTVDVSDSVTTDESVNVSLPEVGVFEIDKSESVTTGESVDVALDDLTVNTSESINASESLSVVTDDLAVNASESITTGESVDVSLPELGTVQVNASESITTGESTSVVLDDLAVDESESITTGESVNLSIIAAGEMAANVTDSITVGESVTLAIGDIQVSATENITTGESVSALITAVSDLSVSVTDGITVNDIISAAISALIISALDTLTVGESLLVSLEGATHESSASESITIGDILAIELYYLMTEQRILSIEYENRKLSVDEEDRTCDIDIEERILSIPRE